jgi:hypothetical protein
MTTDWNDLIQKHISGSASEAESQQLAAEMRINDALADAYVQHIGLEVALEAKAAATECTRELIMTPISVRKAAWHAWRPLSAAVAGIALGVFGTSVVFGLVAQQHVHVAPLSVFDPGLEGLKPLDKGLPKGPDEWGVRSAEFVSAEGDVQPLNGQSMLRLQPTLIGPQDEKLYAHAYQVIDLRSLPVPLLSAERRVEVMASFFRTSVNPKARNYIRVFALNEPPNSATDGFWFKSENEAIVAMAQRFDITPTIGSWQPAAVEMSLPSSAQSLVMIFSASCSRDDESAQAPSYLDEVRVSVHTSQSPTP